MPRTYKQLCGVARALDLIGERWTLLIVRDLLLGPLRFSDLLEFERGIGPNLLTKRLRRLEQLGLVAPIKLGRAQAYELTEEGERLRKVVYALGEFGTPHLRFDGAARRRLDWLMTSVSRRLSGVGDTDPIRVGLLARDDQQRFVATIGPESHVRRGEAARFDTAHLDARVTATPDSYVRWFVHGEPWRALSREGALEIEGEDNALDRLMAALSKTRDRGSKP